MTLPHFLCFMITTYCLHILKFRLNLNARSFLLSKMCLKLVWRPFLPWLQLSTEEYINFPFIKLLKCLHCFQVTDISVYKHIDMTIICWVFLTFYIYLVNNIWRQNSIIYIIRWKQNKTDAYFILYFTCLRHKLLLYEVLSKSECRKKGKLPRNPLTYFIEKVGPKNPHCICHLQRSNL